MAEEKDVFYVVKKGDVVGIYNSFSDIQPLLASSSVSGDSISIHKGYALPKKSEEYLVSHGLKGASYSINASDVHEGLFGRLVTCPYQHPPSTEGRALHVNSSSTRLQEGVQKSVAQSSPFSLNPRPLIVDVPRPEPSTCVARSSLFSTNSLRPLIRNVPHSELSTCKVAGSTSFPGHLSMNVPHSEPTTCKVAGSTSFPRHLSMNVPHSEPTTCKVAGSISFPRSLTMNVPHSEPTTSKVSGLSFLTNSPRPFIMKVPLSEPTTFKAAESSSFSTNTPMPVTTYYSQPEPSACLSCIIHFDGASKGNPGPAGAGAVLRAEDGSKVYRLREGVGVQTNNVAEYRSLILGLKQALKNGYKHIHAKGDSLLVCNQVQGKWKIKNKNMGILCNEAKELKNKFLSFQINHVLREFNSEADAQANMAINLREGQVEEDCAPR